MVIKLDKIKTMIKYAILKDNKRKKEYYLNRIDLCETVEDIYNLYNAYVTQSSLNVHKENNNDLKYERIILKLPYLEEKRKNHYIIMMRFETEAKEKNHYYSLAITENACIKEIKKLTYLIEGNRYESYMNELILSHTTEEMFEKVDRAKIENEFFKQLKKSIYINDNRKLDYIIDIYDCKDPEQVNSIILRLQKENECTNRILNLLNLDDKTKFDYIKRIQMINQHSKMEVVTVVAEKMDRLKSIKNNNPLKYSPKSQSSTKKVFTKLKTK